MRNLVAIQQRIHGLRGSVLPDAPVTAVSWDSSTDDIICAFGPAHSTIEIVRVKQDANVSSFSSWEIPAEESSGKDCILDMHYFDDTTSVCITLSSGNILVVQESQPDQVEIIGTIEEGIRAATWSPDEDVLAIATAASTVILMTRQLEPNIIISLSAENSGVFQPVSVGWGKSETQFKGKHSMRDPTMPEKTDGGTLSIKDDGVVRIKWNGDGAYVALSTIEEKCRTIRIYNREGVLVSMSEPVDGLEGSLSWMPSGNLLTSIQRLNGRLDVVFFERNGLRHGQFCLNVNRHTLFDEVVYDMSWNADSSLLAIHLASRVQIWCSGNYHWYLKQEFRLPKDYEHTFCNILWHREKPLKLACSTYSDLPFEVDSSAKWNNGSASLAIREFSWTIASGISSPTNKSGVVAVIDGSLLHLNPLGILSIPPPMAFRQVAVESTPTDIAVSSASSSIAVLRSSGVDIIHWGLSKKTVTFEPEIVTNIVSFPPNETYRQIIFFGNRKLCLLQDKIDGSCVLKILHLNSAGRAPENVSILEIKSNSVCRLLVLENPLNIGYIDQSGTVFFMGNKQMSEVYIRKLPGRCPSAQVTMIGSECLAMGLAQDGHLFLNKHIISTACTSFTLTGPYLIYTTSKNFLRILDLTCYSDETTIASDDFDIDSNCRRIERGARVVQALPSLFSVVLQMPRGNLETIFPRILVLTGVKKSIERKDYRSAFLACRSHRIDLNILHDHAPAQFMESIYIFVQKVNKAEYIDQFLSQLREEDVSQTIYAETLSGIPKAREDISGASPLKSGISKVNSICSAFLELFLNSHFRSRLQNTITAHVCKSPPDLQAALSLIATLQGTDLQQQAIQHICFLCDVHKLYETALGIYDISLALVIAEQSQRDPREYLPFLQGLLELGEHKRKFTIDDHLGRFAKALTHLHLMGKDVFEDLKGYVVKKELYAEALDLYKYKNDEMNDLMSIYARYLSQNSRFHEAGLAYEYLENYRHAAEEYQKGGLWQEALFNAMRVPLQKEELDRLSGLLAESLYEAQDYESAAIIHAQYRNEHPEAVRILCKGYHFAEAMRIALLSEQSDLVETVIDPALQESFTQALELVADCKQQLRAQVARLQELREKKKEVPPLSYEGAQEYDAPDNVSLASTNASMSGSLFTRYTGITATTLSAKTGDTSRTSKNSRREERKRARGKKGSVYEEEYLINSIRRLIGRINLRNPELVRLAESLLRRGMRDRASAVRARVNELSIQLRSSIGIVFLGHASGTGDILNDFPDLGAFGELPFV